MWAAWSLILIKLSLAFNRRGARGMSPPPEFLGL